MPTSASASGAIVCFVHAARTIAVAMAASRPADGGRGPVASKPHASAPRPSAGASAWIVSAENASPGSRTTASTKSTKPASAASPRRIARRWSHAIGRKNASAFSAAATASAPDGVDASAAGRKAIAATGPYMKSMIGPVLGPA